jgi:hypothetical protein
MAVTLVEFLAPVRTGRQSDVATAALYYLTQVDGAATATATEVKSALVKARISRVGTWNVGRALAHAKENVDRDGSAWSLTETGVAYVRTLLSLPDDSLRAQHDVRSLEALAAGIDDDAVRGYIEESIKCLQVGAYRASIVFLWTGAVATIRDEIWGASGKNAKAIETTLQAHRQNARFRRKDDFAYVKDVDVLQLAEDMAIFDKTQKGILGQALDVRNSCGHPTKYNPGEKKASSFIEDVVGVVF